MAGVINPVCYLSWKVIDADTLTTGVVYAATGSTNVPDDYCIITTYGTTDRVQIAVSRKTNATYSRVEIPGAWVRTDNFGYNTLDELAAALKPKLGLP